MIFRQKVKRPWIVRSNGVWQLADFAMNCDRLFFVEPLVDPREGWVARRVFWTQFDEFDHGDFDAETTTLRRRKSLDTCAGRALADRLIALQRPSSNANRPAQSNRRKQGSGRGT
jgi:hypothetical protein